MKKILLIIISLLYCALLAGCAEQYFLRDHLRTDAPPTYYYEIGEKIAVYDADDDKCIGYFTVKSVIALSDSSVQINYTYDSQIGDSGILTFHIFSGDQKAVNYGYIGRKKYTKYSSKCIDVSEQGEYIDLQLKDNSFETFAVIRAYYAVGEKEADPKLTRNLIIVFAIFAICAALMFISFKRTKKTIAELDADIEKKERESQEAEREVADVVEGDGEL